MRTIEEYASLLSPLLNDVSEEARERVEKLMDDARNDYEEAIGYLSKFGEITNGKFNENTSSDGTDWKAKYEAERERYRKRWETGMVVADKPEGGDVDPAGDVEMPISLDDVLVSDDD